MKRQAAAAFLCGLVLPMVMMALSIRKAVPPEGEVPPASEQQTEPEPVQTEQAAATGYDGETELRVLTENGAVETMQLGEYLVGVVLAEMPADFEPEALMAQSAVARTYTCKRMLHPKHEGAAVCTDPDCCQDHSSVEAYLEAGGTEESVEKIRQAVSKTDGMVLTYEGALIDATYFSCSGGITEDAVAVWGRDVPYLQSVESPGEEQAPRYSERVSFRAEDFCKKIGCSGQGAPAEWFGQMVRTQGGGVESVEICGKTYSGLQLRKLLGLRSTAFTIQAEGDTVTLETKGFGHRVGMSQYGAQAMALDGSGWQDILSHYYQGVSIEAMEKQT